MNPFLEKTSAWMRELQNLLFPYCRVPEYGSLRGWCLYRWDVRKQSSLVRFDLPEFRPARFCLVSAGPRHRSG